MVVTNLEMEFQKGTFFTFHRQYCITQFKLEKPMERINIFLTALVSVITLSACSQPQSIQVSPPEQLPIAASDNGTKVNAFVGQELVITLDGNPSTGYTWETKDMDPTMFSQDGETQFTSSNPDVVGSGGTQTLTIRILKTGNASLTLIYHRPWETDVAPVDTFSFELLVK
jgi:inhibitor of cysteine peptidase